MSPGKELVPTHTGEGILPTAEIWKELGPQGHGGFIRADLIFLSNLGLFEPPWSDADDSSLERYRLGQSMWLGLPGGQDPVTCSD